MDGATVYDGPVADADVVPDRRRGPFESPVNNGSVLDVNAVAAVDAVDVAADNGGVPDGAVVAEYDLSDEGRIFREEAIVAVDGGVVTDGNDEGHYT